MVQGSVVCGKSDSGFDLLSQVIYGCKKENWAENRALRDARGDWDFFRVNSIDYNCLFLIIQKVLYPFRVSPLMP